MNLDELEALEKAATAGPWHNGDDGRLVKPVRPEWQRPVEDAAFIAAARTYFPLLINVARAANGLLAIEGDGSHLPAEVLLEAAKLRDALAALEAGGETK